MIVGIDASRIRSGGAIAHIRGILSVFDFNSSEASLVHIWSYNELLLQIPNHSWLVKHNPSSLEGSLIKQLWWQAFTLPSELRKFGCNVLFSPSGSTFCSFSPLVVLSQDMLSYEPRIMEKFGFGRRRLRLFAILFLQNLSFRRSVGVVFLTRYAARVIQESAGRIINKKIICHGVDQQFIDAGLALKNKPLTKIPKTLTYVSNATPYKNQLQVIDAVLKLREKGYELTLDLVGGGYGSYQKTLIAKIEEVDPDGQWLIQHEFVDRDKLINFLSRTDIFIFASGCENLPVTLLEAMSFSLPIACSDKGPMPEVLQDGGEYFDPESVQSTRKALERLLKSEELRQKYSARAYNLSKKYTWQNCSKSTFNIITKWGKEYHSSHRYL
jgi:glycosyltransferase involved in cell wall biosynthesis